MSLRGSRAALVLGALLLINLWSIEPARADCQPATPANGDIVTCTGTVPAGFAPGVDQLTINILAGAIVGDNGTAGFTLSFGNTVNNFGSIVVGNSRTGILASGNSNVIVNHNTIATGDSGTAIDLGSSSFNTITNNGTISVGSGGTLINTVSNNVVTNNGTMTSQGSGIIVDANNTVINRGTITVTGGGTVISLGANNLFLNSGTINVGCCGLGVFGTDGNTIVNTGTISLGNSAIGIQVGTTSTITNSGTIAGGLNATGIIAGDDNVITNSGTISVGTGGFAMQLQQRNSVLNNGTILGGDGAAGIFLDTDSSVVNNGTIRVGALGISIVAFSTTNVVITNNGTIDGGMLLGTCGCGGTNIFNNNGLLTITNAGTPIGVAGFTIAGTFNQSASGILALRAAPGTNVNDALATDVANLGGTLRLVLTPALYDPVTTYRVLTGTTAINGQFALVEATPFFDATATYNATDVTVTLTRLAYGNARGATINQQAVGRALDASYSQGATGDAASIFINVATSSSTSVLDALSGEAAAALQNGNFAIGNQFLALLLRQSQLARAGGAGGGFAQAFGGQRVQLAGADALADASPAQGQAGATGSLSLWLAGFGGHVSRNGDAGTGSASQSIGFGGVATGVDYRVMPNLLIGASAAFSKGGYTVADRASEGDARNFHVGVYAGWTRGPLYVDGALSFAHGDFTTTRTISVGAAERADASFSGSQFGGRLETGWRFSHAAFEFGPFGGLSVQSLRQNGYSETSRVIATGAPGILGLSVAGRTTKSVRSEFGGQVNASFTVEEQVTIKPRLRLAWAHEFSADRQVTATLNTLPAASFTVSGAPAARNAALVTAGVDFGFASNVTGFAQFDGEFSSSGSSYGGAGGLRVSW